MTVQATGKNELYARYYGGQLVIADEAQKPGVGTGTKWWVDSENTKGADNADTHGHSPDGPFSTVHYAASVCGIGDTIYVMEGHIEDSDAVIFALVTRGTTVIGIGNGLLRPQFHFNNAAATIDIAASDCRLVNLKFMPSEDDVLIGIDIEDGSTGTIIEDCLFYQGEAGTDEFVTCIELKANCHDTLIQRNDMRSSMAATPEVAVRLNGISNRVKIINNRMWGTFSVAGIDDTAACTELLIAANKIKVLDGEPGIELAAGATGIIAENLIESTGINPEVAIVAAACSWFVNAAVVVDGDSAILIGGTDETNIVATAIIGQTLAGTDTGEGSQFAIVSNVTGTSIPNNAQTAPITAVSAVGNLILEDIIVETDATGWVGGPVNIEFTTAQAFGSTGAAAPFGLEIIASFLANLTVSAKDWTTSLLPIVLLTGNQLFIHGDNAAVTGTGVAHVTMIFRRLDAGATIVAADVP